MNLDRQSFLGQRSPQTIQAARIAVIGLCGGGSHVSQQLAHIGFSNILLVDHDRADDTNINRMVGLTANAVANKAYKTDVIAREIMAINPQANVQKMTCKWQECEQILRECNAIIGCVDSFGQREQIERFSRRFMIPYIDVGMDVSGQEGRYFITGQSILSLPGHACMRCMGFLTEEVLAREAGKYGAAGGKPQVVWPNGVLASTAVGQLMSLLTPWNDELATPLYLDYDGNRSIVTLNKRLAFIDQAKCSHFVGPDALGDLEW